MPQYGLVCAPPVRWLIGAEPAVYHRIVDFIAGHAGPVVDVAGPPTAKDMLHRHRKRHVIPDLPLVKLQLRVTKHNLTGTPGIEVKCSDKELDEITRWAREAKLRTALAAQARH